MVCYHVVHSCGSCLVLLRIKDGDASARGNRLHGPPPACWTKLFSCSQRRRGHAGQPPTFLHEASPGPSLRIKCYGVVLPCCHCSAGKDRLVKYWDLDRFELLLELPGHHAEVWSLAVSAFGDFVVTGG